MRGDVCRGVLLRGEAEDSEKKREWRGGRVFEDFYGGTKRRRSVESGGGKLRFPGHFGY